MVNQTAMVLENTVANDIEVKQSGNLIPVQDAPMVAMIERIVMDPNIPLDRLERMLEMKERMEDRAREDQAREARKAYFSAMALCQTELPVVIKNTANSHTRSTYADLAAIEREAMPTIHNHGFMVSFQPAGMNERNELLIKWTVAHNGGHVESDTAEIPVDATGTNGTKNKTGTQAFGSTATYGRRYLLCMLFNISTGDDTDGNTPKPQDDEKITPEQVKTILKLLEETNSDVPKFCQLGKINAVPEMLARQFDSALQMLNQKKAKMGKDQSV